MLPAECGIPEPISPELVLVDPELARRARALLPLPQPAFPRPPRPRLDVADPVAAAVVAGPTQPYVPGVDRRLETVSAPEGDVAMGFTRRLAGALVALPAVIVLALVAELVGTSAGSLGTRTGDRHPADLKVFKLAGLPKSSSPGAGHASPGATRAQTKTEPWQLHGRLVEHLVDQIGRPSTKVTTRHGPPSRWKRNREYCYATWDGLTIILSAKTGNPCERGKVVGALVTQPRWETARGLSVGSSLAGLHRRYPNAKGVGVGWWKLSTIRSTRGRSSVPLHAHVTAGRVDKILVN
jgi:hypothetical protein